MNYLNFFLTGCLVGTGWMLFDNRLERAHEEGFKLGMNYALQTNPPSKELDMVCAGLWVGEQNRKQWEKEQRK